MHLFTESQTCDLGVASSILISWCLCMKIWLNLCNFSLFCLMSIVFLSVSFAEECVACTQTSRDPDWPGPGSRHYQRLNACHFVSSVIRRELGKLYFSFDVLYFFLGN